MVLLIETAALDGEALTLRRLFLAVIFFPQRTDDASSVSLIKRAQVSSVVLARSSRIIDSSIVRQNILSLVFTFVSTSS